MSLMKKILATVFCLILVVSFAICQSREPETKIYKVVLSEWSPEGTVSTNFLCEFKFWFDNKVDVYFTHHPATISQAYKTWNRLRYNNEFQRWELDFTLDFSSSLLDNRRMFKFMLEGKNKSKFTGTVFSKDNPSKIINVVFTELIL